MADSIKMVRQKTAHSWLIVCFMIMIFGGGCDSVEPSEDHLIVVEGFFNAGAPLPSITITKAQTLYKNSINSPEAIDDAIFRIYLNEQPIVYAPSNTEPGKYAPVNNLIEIVPSRTQLKAEIEWKSIRATTQDFIPPSIAIDSVQIKVPDQPVAAILVDTLRFDNPEVGAHRGYIYPIDVTLSWISDSETDADSTYWIETRLIPESDFSSTVLDVFLLTEEVQKESILASNDRNGFYRSWTGVYALPVTDSLSPPPAHNLTVQLIRSTKAYADFAASRNMPERREPVSNIDGAIGVLAGIALDSIAFEVKNGLATTRR